MNPYYKSILAISISLMIWHETGEISVTKIKCYKYSSLSYYHINGGHSWWSNNPINEYYYTIRFASVFKKKKKDTTLVLEKVIRMYIQDKPHNPFFLNSNYRLK